MQDASVTGEGLPGTKSHGSAGEWEGDRVPESWRIAQSVGAESGVKMRAVNLRDPQSTVTLEVQATGATFYKWFHKESEIQGETEAMLTIDNVQPSNAGEYKVQAHNDCDFVESQLTQLAIRHLSNAKFANGKFGFKMDGQAGEVWIFQVSTDLKNWTEAGRVTLDVSGIPVSATGSLAILNGRVVDNGSDPMQTTRMYRILKPQ